MHASCGDSFKKYAKCLENANCRFEECRKEQKIFDTCVEAAKAPSA